MLQNMDFHYVEKWAGQYEETQSWRKH